MPRKPRPVPNRNKFSFWRWIRNGFFAGVVVVTPIAATILLTVTLVNFVDNRIDGLIQWIDNLFPQVSLEFYSRYAIIPGLGVLVAFVGLTILGLFARNIIGRSLLGFGEGIVDRLPFVRSIYGPIKQILETVFRDQGQSFKDVALVEYPRKGMWAICFVTAPGVGEIGSQLEGQHVGVFIPTTPNPTSGFFLYVPVSSLRILDLSLEEGAKLIISAGIVTEQGPVSPLDLPTTPPGGAPAQAPDFPQHNAVPPPPTGAVAPSPSRQQGDGAVPLEEVKKDPEG